MSREPLIWRSILFLRELEKAGSVAEDMKQAQRDEAHHALAARVQELVRRGGVVHRFWNDEAKINMFGEHLIIDDPDVWYYRAGAYVDMPG